MCVHIIDMCIYVHTRINRDCHDTLLFVMHHVICNKKTHVCIYN